MKMDIEKKIIQIGDGSAGLLIPIELLKYLNLELGDPVILRDDVNKRGQKFVSFWKKENETRE